MVSTTEVSQAGAMTLAKWAPATPEWEKTRMFVRLEPKNKSEALFDMKMAP